METRGGNVQQIPIEILIQYPFCWNSSKICDFLSKTHKFCRDHGQKLGNFLEEMDADGVQKGILSDHTFVTDGDALHSCNGENSQYHWHLYLKYFFRPLTEKEQESMKNSNPKNGKGIVDKTLCTEIRNPEKEQESMKNSNPKNGKVIIDKTLCTEIRNPKFASVGFILKQIRDKWEHSGDIPISFRMPLGWFRNNDNGLDPHLYVVYWNRLYPRLLPFLWLQFHKHRDDLTLQSFYTTQFDLSANNFMPISINDFVDQIVHAVQNQEGNFQKRYSQDFPSKRTKVEFLSIPIETMQKLLDGSPTVALYILQDRVNFYWISFGPNGSSVQSMEYKLTSNIFQTSREHALVFANELLKVDMEILGKVLPICGFDYRNITLVVSNVCEQIRVVRPSSQISLQVLLPENITIHMELGCAMAACLEKHEVFTRAQNQGVPTSASAVVHIPNNEGDSRTGFSGSDNLSQAWNQKIGNKLRRTNIGSWFNAWFGSNTTWIKNDFGKTILVEITSRSGPKLFKNIPIHGRERFYRKNPTDLLSIYAYEGDNDDHNLENSTPVLLTQEYIRANISFKVDNTGKINELPYDEF